LANAHAAFQPGKSQPTGSDTEPPDGYW
jgi:hypothetical protein